MIDEVGVAASQDPVIAAALRNRALQERLAALEAELNSAAQGYVPPERMTEMLRELLAAQQGLKLVSLANLPVESLSQPAGAKPGAPIAIDDRGPFLHPVEMVVAGRLRQRGCIPARARSHAVAHPLAAGRTHRRRVPAEPRAHRDRRAQPVPRLDDGMKWLLLLGGFWLTSSAAGDGLARSHAPAARRHPRARNRARRRRY